MVKRGSQLRRIVFVVPDYEPSLGGTTRHTKNLAGALVARGYDVTVLTQRIDMSWPRTEERNGITVHRLGPPGRGAFAMKLLVLHVAWWLRRHRATIAIVNVIMYPDFAVAAQSVGLGATTVMIWAGVGDATDALSFDQTLAKRALARLRRRALGQVANVTLSGTIASELTGLEFGAHPLVIPTPVDPHRYHAPSPSERSDARAAVRLESTTIAFVYCGHLRALKRVDQLLTAFSQLHAEQPDAHLFVVGGSREDLEDRSEELQLQADLLGLADAVTFIGEVDDVVPFLHAADAFVLPSDREGVSNSLIEALACGVPCIAPPSAGGEEVLDRRCGIVPASNNPTDLLESLRRMCDPVERERLQAGAALAAHRFHLDVVMSQFVSLYQELRARQIG